MLDHKDLLQLHDKAYNFGYDTRKKAADDMLFAWITQWDDTYLSNSDLSYRGEFDIIRKGIRHITSDLELNPVSVDFEPVDETSDSDAEIMDGLYRADMRNNIALEAKKNASQEAIVCGVGAWELRTEYKSNNIDDDRQVIIRQPLYEANNNVLWDPNAKLLDKSDAMYVSCLVSYSEDGYLKLKKDLTGEDSNLVDGNFASPEISYVFPWISESKKVIVSRFYHKEIKTINYLTFKNMIGETKTIREDEFKKYEDDIVEDGFNLVSEKKITRNIITRYIASGECILEKTIVAGENIPVVPQYGERQFVEGEEHYEGIVRLAKDPQRLRNFQMSYLADIVSRSPREKPIFTQEQIQGYEDMFELSGADNNYPYLKQNAFDGAGNQLTLGAVGYIKAPNVPPALIESLAETRAAVSDVSGNQFPDDITDINMSGKAINSLAKRMDMQSYIYQDNHKYSVRRDAEIYASMAKDIFDTEQQVTIIKVDGTRKTEHINKTELNYDTFEHETKNNIQAMIFNVYAEISPSFDSVKDQNKSEIKELLNSGTLDQETHTILLNEYLTMVGGHSFKDLRSYARKKLVLMGVKEPETDEEKQMVEQSKKTQKPSALEINAQANLISAQASLKEQENRANDNSLQVAKVQEDSKFKNDKLESEAMLNLAKIKQNEIKLNNDKEDKMVKNAIDMTKVELSHNQEIDSEVEDSLTMLENQ